MNKRKYGEYLEGLALKSYLDQGYTLLERNYTIKGGEIDLIVENDMHRIYVEVKGVDHIDDIHGYVTALKLSRIKRAIAYHILEHPTEKMYQLDVVFMKDNRILDVYDNVSLIL